MNALIILKINSLPHGPKKQFNVTVRHLNLQCTSDMKLHRTIDQNKMTKLNPPVVSVHSGTKQVIS